MSDGGTANEKIKNWYNEHHPRIYGYYRQFGWRLCPIKRQHVSRWQKSMKRGGIKDQ